MKRLTFFAAVLVGIVLTSCSLDQQSQNTPQLQCRNLICYHADSLYIDTLKTEKLDENGVYTMTAIHTGDTVRGVVVLNAITNTLTGFKIGYDSTEMSVQIDSVEIIRHALADTSDPEHGMLQFKPAYCAAAFPFHYIPLKVGSANMTFTVESDSKFSPRTVSMVQPVK